MSKYLWVDRRLSWWLVGFIVAMALMWLGVDIAWRKVTFPITQFFGISLGVVALFSIIYMWLWHRSVSRYESS
jgi:hypothetical protein